MIDWCDKCEEMMQPFLDGTLSDQEVHEAERRSSGFSAADEIAKASELKASGAITDAEFEEMKRKALT